MNRQTPSAEDFAPAARETGFREGVLAMRRALATTPVGWLLVGWMCWGRAPAAQLLLWLGAFFGAWLVSLWVLLGVCRSGPDSHRHARSVTAVALVDGAAWGLMFALLCGYDTTLDAVLGAVMAGVGAVNAPVYITAPRNYRVQIGAMWAVALTAALAHPQRISVMQILAGLTVYLVLIGYYMTTVAARILEGLRLQLANAALTEQLRVALQMVQQEATTDALTGLPNRRALDDLMRRHVALANRNGTPFSVLLLDIDHFKQINDVHGHAAGDEALKAFAARIGTHLRAGDVCARYGGEEFVAVLPSTDLRGALELGERLRGAVAGEPLLTAPLLRATVSIGAAQCLPGRTPQELLNIADAAVYMAKNGGRDQVRACTPPLAA